MHRVVGCSSPKVRCCHMLPTMCAVAMCDLKDAQCCCRWPMHPMLTYVARTQQHAALCCISGADLMQA
eukprot:863187-Pelagomonas_calceolata.AAC.2